MSQFQILPDGPATQLKVTSNGRRIYEFKFTAPGAGWNRQTANQILTNFSKGLAQTKKGNIYVASYEKNGWYAGGKNMPVGGNVSLFNGEDYDGMPISDKVKHIRFYYMGTSKQGGVTDTHNDCFYYALKKALNVSLPNALNKPERLKWRLKLERNDMIGLEHIPEIENIIKCCINVAGDHPYQGQTKYKDVINLKLENCHYTLLEDDDKKKDLLVKKQYYVKSIVSYTLKDGLIEYYDGNEIKASEYRPFFSTHPNAKWILLKIKNNKDLKIEYDSYIKSADALKLATKGQVNLYEANMKETALRKLYDMSKTAEHPEPLTQAESEWIHDAYTAGLIFATPGTYENVTTYDVNSFYPKNMISIMFPFKAGEFKELEELPESVPFGIFYCVIEKSNDESIDKKFRFNYKNKYTHQSIIHARELGLKINLIKGQNNHLFYPKESLRHGKHYFGTYINYFYELKKNNVDGAKALLNILSGALNQVDSKVEIVKSDGDEVALIGTEIKSIMPLNDKDTKISYYKTSNLYYTNYGRVGPFMTAYGRLYMSRLLNDHMDKVVRCHTDGFTCKEPIPEFILGDGLGELKIEQNKCGKCVIVNCQTLEFAGKK